MNRFSGTASASPLTNPLLLVMVLAAFTSVLNNSMVNVAIPTISRHLEVSPSLAGWVITAFSIVFATGVALYGRVSDSYSFRGTFLAALVIFGAGSLTCALAPTFSYLVAGRAIQAAGAAAIPSLAFGSVARLFPPGRRGVVFGTLSSAVGLGAAAGPLVGGLGVSAFGWRVLFYGTLAVIGILFIAAWRFLPDLNAQREPQPHRFVRLDLPGGLMLALGAAALLYGVTAANHVGLAAPRAWGTLILAAAMLAGFALRIRTAAYPFVPPALFANRQFLSASGIALLSQGAFIGGGLFLTPLLLINELGLSAFQTGLVIAPGAFAVALLAPTIGRLSDKFGPRAVLGISLSCLLTGLLFMSSFAVGAAPWLVAVALVIASTGYAGVTSPAANAASKALSAEIAGVGFGIYQLFFFMGAGTGAAVFGTVLSARQRLGDAAFNPLYAGGEATAAFSDAYLVACVAVLLALVLLTGLGRADSVSSDAARGGG
ncbi:MFS transporter [Salinisphaera orenii]|uniref:MFS transporter n=1 Tax=Salinisphaera orenii YIM 95161 TaxID=1051139 RepID=A0A423PDQ0_9GAMM|nr:MFS transporter [Salinisphaera halophila]ROO23088.1 MFS transporter [Salinisphaera halophila YIM 95161]